MRAVRITVHNERWKRVPNFVHNDRESCCAPNLLSNAQREKSELNPVRFKYIIRSLLASNRKKGELNPVFFKYIIRSFAARKREIMNTSDEFYSRTEEVALMVAIKKWNLCYI